MERGRADDVRLVTVLGPTTIGGRPLTPRQRALTAALVLRRGGPCPAEDLIDVTWGASVPATARASLLNQISRLRAAFGPDVIVSQPGGYRLTLPSDVDRIDAVARRWLDRPVRPAAIPELEAAVRSWGGEPYVDLGDLPAIEVERTRLQLQRASLVEHLAVARLAAGAPGLAADELEALVVEDPYRERAWGLLILALHRAGRRPEALVAYQRLEIRLADDLGARPSPWVRSLHRAVQEDEALDLRVVGGGAGPVPAGACTRGTVTGRCRSRPGRR